MVLDFDEKVSGSSCNSKDLSYNKIDVTFKSNVSFRSKLLKRRSFTIDNVNPFFAQIIIQMLDTTLASIDPIFLTLVQFLEESVFHKVRNLARLVI